MGAAPTTSCLPTDIQPQSQRSKNLLSTFLHARHCSVHFTQINLSISAAALGGTIAILTSLMSKLRCLVRQKELLSGEVGFHQYARLRVNHRFNTAFFQHGSILIKSISAQVFKGTFCMLSSVRNGKDNMEIEMWPLWI